MTTFRIPMRLAATATALLLFAGCGAMTSAPVLDDSVRIDANDTAPQSSALPIDTPAETGPGGGGTETSPTFPDTFDGTSQSSELTSSLGGMLRNGRWKLVVPSGAFQGSALVSISTPHAKAWECGLRIFPQEKNQFEVPVLLVADCHTVTPRQLAHWAIFSFDANTQTWVRVPDSVVDLRKKTVTAPLFSFSTAYKVGPNRGPLGL